VLLALRKKASFHLHDYTIRTPDTVEGLSCPMHSRSVTFQGPDNPHALYHPEAVFANEEHRFVSHSLSLSLLTHFHRVSAEKKLAEQAQQPVALAPIRVEFETDTHRI
jgi:hypothetical protein